MREARSARRGRGGKIPGMPGPPKSATAIALRLKIEDKARWKAWAKRRRTALTELIREAVERAIREEEAGRSRK